MHNPCSVTPRPSGIQSSQAIRSISQQRGLCRRFKQNSINCIKLPPIDPWCLLRVSVDLPFEDDLGRLCRLGYGIERQPHGQSSAVDHHADCGTKDTPGTPGIVGDGGEVNLQAQQQDFVHRIKHLAALARVRQLPEMIKKNDLNASAISRRSKRRDGLHTL